MSRNIPHFHKCKVSDSRVRVDIQIRTRKGRTLCSANTTHSWPTPHVHMCVFVYTHVVTLIGENWHACQPIKCYSLCLIPFIHAPVSACLCLTCLQTKGAIDPKVGQHPLEYTFLTLSGRNMHNDTAVNIPTKASPAAEQFTANMALNDCVFSVKLPNYLLGRSSTSSDVRTRPKCSNDVPLEH